MKNNKKHAEFPYHDGLNFLVPYMYFLVLLGGFEWIINEANIVVEMQILNKDLMRW